MFFFADQTNRGTALRATAHISIIIIAGAICSLVFVASQFPLVVSPKSSFCNNYYYINVLSFGFAVFCIYFALWYRVFVVFYRNKFMRQSIEKYLQYINTSAMPLLCAMVISNIAVFLSSPGYVSAGCGCKAIVSVDGNPLNLTIRWVILITCTLVFQIVLLFSFIHPLNLHRKKMLQSGKEYKATIPLVKRAAIVGVICIMSDLINFGFAVFFRSSTVYIYDIVVRCNILVNLVGTIVAFADWREKLFPFNKKLHPDVKQMSQPTPNNSTMLVANFTNEERL